jgi:hypothetical protein
LAEQVITKEQIRNLILAEKLKPSDLFGAESLTEDPVVKGYVDSEKRSATAGEYAHRKRTEEVFDKTRADLEKKLQEREAELGRLRLDAAKGKVGSIFDKLNGERKLSERQVKFVKTRLERFAPKEVEKLEDEFKAYLDSEIDEEAKLAKLYGIEDKKDEGAGGTTDPGTGPDKTKTAQDAASKYLDPKRNPFIKV